MSVWNLDNSVVMDSIGTPLLSTARATDIRDMESVITRLQQITSKISRYVGKVSTDTVRSGATGAKTTCCLKVRALWNNSVSLFPSGLQWRELTEIVLPGYRGTFRTFCHSCRKVPQNSLLDQR